MRAPVPFSERKVAPSQLQVRLATLETKLEKLKSGELSAEYLETEADQQIRQGEAIARTEKFIRSLKEQIAQEAKATESPAPKKNR